MLLLISKFSIWHQKSKACLCKKILIFDNYKINSKIRKDTMEIN